VGQYQLNKGRYAELLSDYHKAVISAFGNVEDALVSVQQTAEQLRREQEAVATARHAYELTQAQFHAGTINILVVLSTETALFTAQDTLVQVKYSPSQCAGCTFQCARRWLAANMNRIRMSGPRVVMLGAALALTVVFFVWHGYSGGARAADKDKKGDGSQAIAVETAMAGRSDVPVYLEGWARCRRSTP